MDRRQLIDHRSFVDQIEGYIETTIQAQGYDKQEFLNFLKSKKANGDNLNLWSMDELLLVGSEFIALKQENNSSRSSPPQNDVELINNLPQFQPYPQFNNYQTPENYVPQMDQQPPVVIQPIQSQISPVQQPNPPLLQYPPPPPPPPNQQPLPQQIIPPRHSIISEVQRYKVYPGKQYQINQNSFLFKNPNIDVKVHGYKEQPGSLFSKAYILYNIVLQPYGHQINRRYSDFDKLREYLVKNYPDFYIPPIPKKVSSSTTPLTADYRQISLESFMNLIIKSFWFDPVVDAFFSCQNENELSNKLKQQKQRNIDISTIETLTGQVECQISAQIDNYFVHQLQALDKDNECYRNIREISKKILITNKQLSQDYKQLGDQFTNLLLRARNQNDLIAEKVDDQVFKNLAAVCQTWSKKQEDIGNIMTKNITYFFKYQCQVLDALKEKIKLREVMREETVKQLQKIDSKIDKQFKDLTVNDPISQKPKDQQQALVDKIAKQNLYPKEMKQYETIQDNFGYTNNSIYQQVQFAINLTQQQTSLSFYTMFQKFEKVHLELIKDFESQFQKT